MMRKATGSLEWDLIVPYVRFSSKMSRDDRDAFKRSSEFFDRRELQN